LTAAYLNRIATSVPPHDVHDAFLRFAESSFGDDERRRGLLRRMAERAGIEHRWSHLLPCDDASGATVDGAMFYQAGGFPDTAARMRVFERHAPALAADAVEKLNLGADRDRITHLLITCCTGFSAPGLDLELVTRCRLPTSIERTMIGFMGCYAAMNALKLARHIVRSEPTAKVLVINLELCTLHLKEATELDQMLSFLLFGDGCAASLVTAEPTGIALDRFRAVLVPDTQDLITWHIRDFGFDMVLSGEVPAAIQRGIRAGGGDILDGAAVEAIELWAVHPGGRTVLDAVERGFRLPQGALAPSREVLRRVGNTSSAAVMFVLESMLRQAPQRGEAPARGCAMAFGPGLVAETMLFRAAA
jgi:predicted naringenin-chalcone synthase